LRWTELLQGSIPGGLRRVDFVAKEYIGLIVYYLRGRTNALLPAP
jgi:hypothetical protein